MLFRQGLISHRLTQVSEIHERVGHLRQCVGNGITLLFERFHQRLDRFHLVDVSVGEKLYLLVIPDCVEGRFDLNFAFVSVEVLHQQRDGLVAPSFQHSVEL